MLHPSYVELMKIINERNGDDKESPYITSRYSIVIAASKRARQLIDGDEKLAEAKCEKPLSIAISEIEKGKILLDKY